MRIFLALTAGALLTTSTPAAPPGPELYRNDFEKAEVGKLPEDLMVLEGAWTVQQEGGNKFLELPGAPLDAFGVLFGTNEKEDVTASARIFGTAKGRRAPSFALGLNGTGGYRVQVSPAKKLLELYRADDLKKSVPFDWQSGQWTQLRLRVEKTASGWRVQGKAWMEGSPEPQSWSISAEDDEELPPGMAAVFGSPFAGTPIRFDDLVVTRLGKE